MNKKFAALISVFIIIFVLFISIVAFNEPLKKFTSAAEDSNPSADASLVFAWPITAQADGVDVVNIDVFVRSATGKPLSSKSVVVTSSLGSLTQTTSASDKSGKASFTLTSTQPGAAEISAFVDGTLPLTKRATVKFE